MAQAVTFEEPHGNPLIRWGLIALCIVAVLALIIYFYNAFNGVHGVKVEADKPVSVSPMLPPPPPPPPPPKPEEKPPEPTEKPTPTPSPSPEPKASAPAPMQQNSEAQAGGTLASGSGPGTGAPGSTGTCIGNNCGVPSGGISDGFYRRYLSTELQQRVQEEDKVNRFVFTADFAIWISPAGAVTKVELLKGSGDGRRDGLLAAVLSKVRGLDAPPSSIRFPQRITVRGRKSF